MNAFRPIACVKCDGTGFYELAVIAHREVEVSSEEVCTRCDSAAIRQAQCELEKLSRAWVNRQAYR